MWERQLALHPLSFAIVLSVRCHASLPYVRSEHTAVRYIRSFRSSGIASELNTCVRAPHLLEARAHLLLTSCMCDPSAENVEPRYLKQNTFLSLLPSHLTRCLAFWASLTFSRRTFLSAHVPLKFWSLSGPHSQLFICIFTPNLLRQGLSQCGHLQSLS